MIKRNRVEDKDRCGYKTLKQGSNDTGEDDERDKKPKRMKKDFVPTANCGCNLDRWMDGLRTNTQSLMSVKIAPKACTSFVRGQPSKHAFCLKKTQLVGSLEVLAFPH